MELNTDAWQQVQRSAPEWFRDAKFGLFFHWGPYCVPACENEWYSRNMYAKGLSQNVFHTAKYGPVSTFGYKDFFPMFTGDAFDAEAWADVVTLSGAKYAGPVTEHSDNFSLWDSKVNPVNSVNYGPHRDITGECFAAFEKRGIRLLATFHHQWLWGWFMSSDNEADVYRPENECFYGPALPLETNRYLPYRLPDKAFNDTWRDKILEVTEKYHPDIVYFDSRTCIISPEHRHAVTAQYYAANPNGIISYKQEDFPQGIGVLDLERGSFEEIQPQPWQIDDRLEDNVTWCIVQEPKYRKAADVIHQLCDVVSKNGNLLLNVGPRADGSFAPEALRELEAIGKWLACNGEAIFGTRPFEVYGEGPTKVATENYDISKVQQQLETGQDIAMAQTGFTAQDIRYTQNGENIYAIGLGYPDSTSLCLKSIAARHANRVQSVTLLDGGDGIALAFTVTPQGLQITLPAQMPCREAFALRLIYVNQ